jgi:hypothetical protein
MHGATTKKRELVIELISEIHGFFFFRKLIKVNGHSE